MSGLSKTLKEKSYSLQLVTASDAEGQPFYAYMVVPHDRVADFKRQLESGDVEMDKFGIVLASGKGHTPSQEHTDYISKRFGN